jgi:hypothetical protein
MGIGFDDGAVGMEQPTADQPCGHALVKDFNE